MKNTTEARRSRRKNEKLLMDNEMKFRNRKHRQKVVS